MRSFAALGVRSKEASFIKTVIAECTADALCSKVYKEVEKDVKDK